LGDGPQANALTVPYSSHRPIAVRTDELLGLIRQAGVVFADVLRNVTPEQLALPTINDEWDVRALINHVVLGCAWEAELVRIGDAPRPHGDLIGDRAPLDAYTTSMEAMHAAFAAPGALKRTVSMPAAEISAVELAAFRVVDLVSHAWDLARATGQNTDLAPDVCEAALSIARQRLGGWDRSLTPFKEELAAPIGASAADRLAAYLGKQV
jgi:uncharacterized protein (TIGR03086 family)